VFAFGAASGPDLVLDFQQSLDKLDVREAGLTIDEFEAQVVGNVVNLDGGNGVTVMSTRVSGITICRRGARCGAVGQAELNLNCRQMITCCGPQAG
jgi:hypothetical protein